MVRTNNFDGIRLLGAMLVLCSHQFAISGRPEPLFLGPHGYGNLGVLIFFSISGFLVKASWQNDPDLTRFLSRRFLRLVPALAVCIPLTMLVVAALGLTGFPDNPHHALNGSLWTIKLEVYCYLILAAFALVMPRSGLAFTLVMLVGWWIFRDARQHTVFHFGLLFGVGMLLQEYPRLRTGKAVGGLIGAGFLLIPTGHYQLALALIVAPLAVWIGCQSWPILRSAGNFGDLSYGVYIYAWPVQQWGVALLGRQTPYLVLLVVTLAVTGVLAALSWHLIEKPALKLKPRKTSVTEPKPSAAPVPAAAD